MLKERFATINMEQNLTGHYPAPILFTGFYRSGTTFFGEVLKPATRAVTEPLGYFTDIPHEQMMTTQEFKNDSLHPTFQKYDIVFHRLIQSWLQNGNNNPNPALIKETEIAFRMGWLSRFLPAYTQMLVVHRDPRGIFASFKNDNLYEEWDFDNRFKRLSTTVKTQQAMREYLPIIQEVEDRDEWIDKLSVYYAIAMHTLHKAVRTWSGNVVEYRYETLMQHPQSELERITRSLGLKRADEINQRFRLLTSSTSPNANTDPHAVFKKSVNVFDWQSILTADESKRIEYNMQRWGRSVDLVEVPESQAVSSHRLRGKDETKKTTTKEYTQPTFTTREHVIQEMKANSIPVASLPNKEIAMSATHITNEQMAYFFNWFTEHSVPLTNKRPNPFINDVLLSRIRKIDEIWQVEKSFTDHPATYCTHLAYTAFALWCGGRLPTVSEWEHAASGGKNIQYPWGDETPSKDTINFGGNKGKTTSVKKLSTQNAQGFYDLAGNVADWTSEVDFSSFEAITKGGSYKDGAENLQIKAQGKRVICLGAMSVGARVVFDKGKEILSDKDFLLRLNLVFNNINDERLIYEEGMKKLMKRVYQILS